MSQQIFNLYESFKTSLEWTAIDQLKSIDFAVKNLSKMIHQQLGSNSALHRSMDADTLRWLIQRELDRRKAGELPYAWSQMYNAMGIPKEFLK